MSIAVSQIDQLTANCMFNVSFMLDNITPLIYMYIKIP